MDLAIARLESVAIGDRHRQTADFFVVLPTSTGRLLFVLVMLAHHRQRVVHVAVTAHPAAVWTAQQLREAFPGITDRAI
jgi:hypothetical protein